MESRDPTDGSDGAPVGVVTVAYRSDAVLGRLLASVEAASVGPTAVVVVDNAPDDGSRARQLAAASGADYVARPGNPGYGAAANTGVARLPASVRWALICNPDVELDPGSIDALRRAGEADAAIGAVGPVVLEPDGAIYPSARPIPSIRTGVGHALFVDMWPGNPWTRSYRPAEAPRARDAGWLSGSCLLVRRDAFDQIGGFDEGYFMYFEDVDLGFRLGRAGYRNRYEPTARVTHLGAHSTQQESDRMIRAHHASARRFLTVKYPGPALWPVRAALGIGLRVRSSLLSGRARREVTGTAR